MVRELIHVREVWAKCLRIEAICAKWDSRRRQPPRMHLLPECTILIEQEQRKPPKLPRFSSSLAQSLCQVRSSSKPSDQDLLLSIIQTGRANRDGQICIEQQIPEPDRRRHTALQQLAEGNW